VRVQGWEKRLADFIDAQKDTPFEWGKNDCVIFTVMSANEIVDRDLKSELETYGAYDKEKAIDILRGHGGSISTVFDLHFKRKLKSFIFLYTNISRYSTYRFRTAES